MAKATRLSLIEGLWPLSPEKEADDRVKNARNGYKAQEAPTQAQGGFLLG
jgi:hypothetical protein